MGLILVILLAAIVWLLLGADGREAWGLTWPTALMAAAILLLFMLTALVRG
jgi:hypothetical protein